MIICKFTAVKLLSLQDKSREDSFSLYKVRDFPDLTAKSFCFSWRERTLPAPSVCCVFDLYWLLKLCFSSPFLSRKCKGWGIESFPNHWNWALGFLGSFFSPSKQLWGEWARVTLRQKAVQWGLQSLCCCKTSIILATLLIRYLYWHQIIWMYLSEITFYTGN